ncbi:hypothetical protein DYD21_06150 [Rhodohalobacter sp. SW132]|nr:hypothetical protein DYD21_06150 [Rhodohalobacter sp. SW132]
MGQQRAGGGPEPDSNMGMSDSQKGMTSGSAPEPDKALGNSSGGGEMHGQPPAPEGVQTSEKNEQTHPKPVEIDEIENLGGKAGKSSSPNPE